MAAVTISTTLALGAAACSSSQSDLSGNLATAESRLTSAQIDARQRVNNADARQAEDRIADAKKGVSDAKSAIDDNRADVKSSTQPKINKLDSEASAYRERAQSFTGDKRTAFDTEWRRYQASLSETQAKYNALDSATNETWTSARDSLMGSVDSLSTSVDDLGKFFIDRDHPLAAF